MVYTYDRDLALAAAMERQGVAPTPAETVTEAQWREAWDAAHGCAERAAILTTLADLAAKRGA